MTSLIEYPCDIPVKIMGETRDGFTETIVEVVRRYAPDFDAATVEMRPSSGGKYLSITCTIRATSREQLDALDQELKGHPWVKIVL